jgi:actin-related protein 8
MATGKRKRTQRKRSCILHPGSRNLRLGRASDFYPHEVPNCIARPPGIAGGKDAPTPGKRSADEAFDANIGHLREYLRNRLRQNKLTTDWKEGARVKAANAKAKPESIPEHNDPRRIEWTEDLDGRKFVVGTDALRLPVSKGWRIRYPILQRKFNTRDWDSHQLLLDDFTIILQESLRTELGIKPIDYKVGYMELAWTNQ